MKIYLIRHGQSTSDIEDRYGGDYDDHLTDKGKRQAEQLAKTLSGKNIEVIFTSSRFRARETAEILKKTLKCELRMLKGIEEMNRYGILTGMKKDEAKEKYPEQVRMLKDIRSTPEGAEPYDDFKERILGALKVATDSGLGTVAIVTHGGPIKCLLMERFKRHELGDMADCGFFELDYSKGKLSITDESHAWLK